MPKMTTQPAGTGRHVTVHATRLTAEAFEPYGRVISTARADLTRKDGDFTARLHVSHRVPAVIENINRHMDHSQLFIPLGGAPVVIVVAPPDQPMDGFDPSTIVAFVADGTQAFTFDAGTWHIEPRALVSDTCNLINVQTRGYERHTELIRFAEHHVNVALTVDVAGL